MELSTEELLQNLEESGIKVTEEEAQRFRGNIMLTYCVICSMQSILSKLKTL